MLPTPNLKILAVIASYGTKNDHYLSRLIDTYSSLPHSVDVVVLSNLAKSVPQNVELIVGLPTKDPWSLPFGHKQVFADRRDLYDLFIYSEDDTLITEHHISAFLTTTEVLPPGEIAGFLRSEVAPDGSRSFCDIHGPYHWDADSVCQRGDYTLAYFSNEHSACYMLTHSQLIKALASGGFLVAPHDGKYDLACTAATDPYTQCGFTKLIPISHFDDFVVPHLPNRYVGTLGLPDFLLRQQLNTLLNIGRQKMSPYSLFATETKLHGAAYSKDYYEPVSPTLLEAIPPTVQTALSLGCGSGALETSLVQRGVRVVAAPIDPVIASGLEEQGVTLVHGTLESAYNQLRGSHFDCILMSNVLQFIQDPVELLTAYAQFLGPGATIVTVLPNFKSAANVLRNGLETSLPNKSRQFETMGVHSTSHRLVRQWFTGAGLAVIKTINIVSGRARTAAKATFGLGDSFLASEFVTIGKSASP